MVLMIFSKDVRLKRWIFIGIFVLIRTNAEEGLVGDLSEEFIKAIIPNLKKVKSLNLFEQRLISEATLMKLITWCPNLESICLNRTNITETFLEHLINFQNSINYLSIVGCEQIFESNLIWFLGHLDLEGKKVEKIYTDLDIPLHHESIVESDEWFIDEKLDIFSIWDTIVRNE